MDFQKYQPYCANIQKSKYIVFFYHGSFSSLKNVLRIQRPGIQKSFPLKNGNLKKNGASKSLLKLRFILREKKWNGHVPLRKLVQGVDHFTAKSVSTIFLKKCI